MKQLRALYQRVGYTVSSFVLALSMVTAAVPFILSERVGAVSVVHTNDLSTWYTGDTRATGHNQLVPGGLRVWTEGATSTDKAAGYYATPGLALNDIDSTSIDFVSYTGGRPSVQLGVDRDGNGTWDGYLVYEPWAYGDGNYWATRSGFGVPAGSGYDSMGTLSDYKAANPNAQVISIGYSLGSGVYGDAVIRSITVGDTTYTFSAKPDIHSLRFSTINSSYKGIVIDQYVRNFTDAISYKATIHRADGSSVSREGRADTLNHINQGGNRSLTTPFNFAGSSDGPWFGPLDAIWLPSTKPVGVTIEINTVSNGLITLSTPISQTLVERSGSYNSLIPVYNPTTDINVSVNAEGLVGSKFTVSGDAYAVNGLNRVYVQLVNRENSQRYGGETINLIGSGNSASWSHEYDANKLNLPEGRYAAHVEVVDIPGNRGFAGWTDNFRLDKTMPVFEMVTPENNDTVKGVQTIRAKITDANDIKKVLVNVGDGKGNYVWEEGKTNNKVTRDGDEFYIDIDTKTLPEGVNYVVLRATDGAGNTRYWNNNANTRQHSYIVDNTAPTSSITSANVSGDVLSFEGSVNDNNLDYYYCYLTTNQTIVVDGHTFTPGQEVRLNNNADSSRNAACSTTWARGATEFTGVLGGFNITGVPDGDYTVKLVAYDKLSNNNASNPTVYTVTIDRTAPVITVNGGNVTLTVGDAYVDQGATATDSRDGSVQVFDDSDLAVDTTVAGIYTVTYTATDEAGNTATATRTVTVVEPAPQVVDGEDGTSGDDEDDEPAEVAAVLFPAGFASIVDTNPDLTPDTEGAEDADQDVAGATTDNAAQVAGASDEASWLGLAWYWWVLIGAAVLGAAWWLAGAIRRRGAEAEA